jgi:hypothetical protein
VLGEPAVSPDGCKLLFSARDAEGTPHKSVLSVINLCQESFP